MKWIGLPSAFFSVIQKLKIELWAFCFVLSLLGSSCTQNNQAQPPNQAVEENRPAVKIGAEVLIETGLNALQGKRVAVVANQASLVYDSVHVIDALKKAGVNIVTVFAPEHGFRGNHEAGATVENEKDIKTGLPILSLHGKFRKPSPEQLANVDAVVFDIQDVGTRFYTYLATLVYVMEACAENNKELMVLDRPNPNGWYVDGPVMEDAYKSFLGLHNIPIVHGMTLGEYARMANYEGWLAGKKKCNFQVIKMEGYRHAMRWKDTRRRWTPPSPNLQTPMAAYCYPFFCWFEATVVSEGRGSDAPFQQIGFPYHVGLIGRWKQDSLNEAKRPVRLPHFEAEVVQFKPRSIPGVAANPKYQDTLCFGVKLNQPAPDTARLFIDGLELLLNFRHEYYEYFNYRGRTVRRPFFSPFFEKLSGSAALRVAIERGDKPEKIWQSWQKDIDAFKKIRQRYLLYP